MENLPTILELLEHNKDYKELLEIGEGEFPPKGVQAWGFSIDKLKPQFDLIFDLGCFSRPKENHVKKTKPSSPKSRPSSGLATPSLEWMGDSISFFFGVARLKGPQADRGV